MVGTTMKMLLDEVSVYLIKFDGNALAATSRRRRRSRHCSVSAHAQKRRVKKCRFVWQRCCCCRCCCAAVNALGALFFCIDQKLAVVLPLITCLSLALPLSDFANLIPKWPPRWCRAFDPLTLFTECKREIQSNPNEEIDSACKRGNHKARRTRRYTESWTQSSHCHQGRSPQGVSAASARPSECVCVCIK